ncbi:Heat shock protein, HSP20 family [Burkholderia cenocepacia PC184]|nr:Heat shock protein, HSP20 family [Burkholderia cenocepacia PC184]
MDELERVVRFVPSHRGNRSPIMSDIFFPTDLLAEFDRLQRQMASVFTGFPASLRAPRPGTFPPVNIGSTDDTIEIVAFAPGLDPAKIDISVDRRLLTISGERTTPDDGTTDDERRIYANERFMGTFRRVVELPQHADPDKIEARYTNGCLTISVGKSEASKPRAITVQ